MLCYVYRSPKKDEMYLYLLKREQFDAVPEALLKVFGKPEYALHIDLSKRDKLAREDIQKVTEKLKSDGYFLQMPPSVIESLNPKQD